MSAATSGESGIVRPVAHRTGGPGGPTPPGTIPPNVSLLEPTQLIAKADDLANHDEGRGLDPAFVDEPGNLREGAHEGSLGVQRAVLDHRHGAVGIPAAVQQFACDRADERA